MAELRRHPSRAGTETRRTGGADERPPALATRDLSVAYRDKPVLLEVDLAVPQGVLAAVVGPNGAGKSTLLKTVLGMLRPLRGESLVFGRPYREQRRRVAYVPQRSSVDWDFPTTALDVVMMGLYGRLGWLRRPGAGERRAAEAALEQVGMLELAGRQISQLSGGQQQRVFLARALVQDAELYLMDEPMAGVDATTERAVLDLLGELRDRGKTVVVVHHDLQTVQSTFEWMALLNVGLIAQGAVAEVFTAANLRRAYGGQIALLSERPEPGGAPIRAVVADGGGSAPLPGPAASGERQQAAGAAARAQPRLASEEG